MKSLPFLSLLLAACVSQSTSTETATDSLAQVTDTVAINTTPVSETVATTVDASLPDSLKNNPLAVYHGYYRLSSPSSAEQARMTISFEGNNTLSYAIDYGVADFCSGQVSGTFVVENGVGYDPVEVQEDANRASYLTGQLAFTLGDNMIKVADGINIFGVGVCNYSGDFIRCDGKCPEIQSEDYGEGETESDTVR